MLKSSANGNRRDSILLMVQEKIKSVKNKDRNEKNFEHR
jgi:hypothetical protein